MGRAEAIYVLRAWTGPQQDVGVKIKLDEGQHKVGGTHQNGVSTGPKLLGRAAGQAGTAAWEMGLVGY